MQSIADAVIVLWGWRRFAVAALAGALSALAFAPFHIFPVLWVTVPVFVWLIDGAEPDGAAKGAYRLLPAAIVGFAFGLGFFVAGLWWIGAAFLVDAGRFAWALPLAVLALPAFLALFWALGAAAARALWVEGWPRLMAFAGAMAIAEWLRGHVLTGFPWNAFGYALTPTPLMMQSASLIGIWGLTLVAFFVFAVPALLIAGEDRVRVRTCLAAAAALLLAHVGYGALRLAGGADETVPNVHLRIVQPSIPQDERWASDRSDAIMNRYVELSRSGVNAMADVTHLIWPESAFPFLLTERPSALAAIADLLPSKATLLTGAARADRAVPAGEPPLVYNSVYVIDADGEIEGAYDKVHLVPFGEYLPFRFVLSAFGLRQLIALPSGFSPGQKLRTLTVPGAPPVGPLVCYEIIFPAAATEPGNRPAWLLNVTNDAWYGTTPGPYQHLLQARVRAVEEGLPLVRAANSGISAIVDGHGRITAELGLNRVGVLDGRLPAALPPTLYATIGDLTFLVLLMVNGLVGAVGKIHRVSRSI